MKNKIWLRGECVWVEIARYLDGDKDIEDIVGQWDAARAAAMIARFKIVNKTSDTERVRVSKVNGYNRSRGKFHD